MHRRRFLATASLALLQVFRPVRAAALPPPFGRTVRSGIVRLASGHYLVEGWVLTAADLQVLEIQAA